MRKDAAMAPRRKKVYEGKAKILYEGTEPGTEAAETNWVKWEAK